MQSPQVTDTKSLTPIFSVAAVEQTRGRLIADLYKPRVLKALVDKVDSCSRGNHDDAEDAVSVALESLVEGGWLTRPSTVRFLTAKRYDEVLSLAKWEVVRQARRWLKDQRDIEVVFRDEDPSSGSTVDPAYHQARHLPRVPWPEEEHHPSTGENFTEAIDEAVSWQKPLYEVLARLVWEYPEVRLLYGGYNVKESSERLGCSQDRVYRHLKAAARDARYRLRLLFDEDSEPPETLVHAMSLSAQDNSHRGVRALLACLYVVATGELPNLAPHGGNGKRKAARAAAHRAAFQAA